MEKLDLPENKISDLKVFERVKFEKFEIFCLTQNEIDMKKIWFNHFEIESNNEKLEI